MTKLSLLNKADATKGTQSYAMNVDLQAKLELPSVRCERDIFMTVINTSMISLSRVKISTGKWSKMRQGIIYRISPRVTGKTAEVAPRAECQTGENETSQTKRLTFATRCICTSVVPILVIVYPVEKAFSKFCPGIVVEEKEANATVTTRMATNSTTRTNRME